MYAHDETVVNCTEFGHLLIIAIAIVLLSLIIALTDISSYVIS